MSRQDYSVVNKFCTALPNGHTFEAFPFGTATLIGFDAQATAAAYAEGDECDMYTVNHSGFNHCWSAASVAAAVSADRSK